MDDAERVAGGVGRGVRRVQPQQDTVRDARRDLPRASLAGRRAVAKEARERLAVDVFHHEEELVLGRHDIEDRDDVGVADAFAQPRFLEEHRDELGVARVLLVEPLDGHRLRKAGGADRAPEVHGGHAAGRELAVELVSAHHARLCRDRHPLENIRT